VEGFLEGRGEEMHWAFTQQMADGRIDQWHREAEQARLSKVATQQSAKHEGPGAGFRVRAYRKALAAVALSTLMLLGLATAAQAYPTDAGSQSEAIKKGPAGVELCMRKQSPDAGLCRDAATGSLGPVAPAEAVEAPAVEAQSADFDARLVLLLGGLLLLGAGGVTARVRRHATA
jgi:hypothetical protein